MKPQRPGDEPYVLGISASHNAAACLLKGETIVCAIQEERLSRIKRQRIYGSEPAACIQYCLDTAGIDASQLSAITVCPQKRSWRPEHDVRLNPILRPASHGTPVHIISHHFGHAMSVFATSGFDDAAVLVVDGLGSSVEDIGADELAVAAVPQADGHETLSIYHFNRKGGVPLYKELVAGEHWLGRGAWQGKLCPAMPDYGSLGGMYGAAAAQIFGDETEAGKVMGLAAYGKPVHPVEDFLAFGPDGIVYTNRICEKFRHGVRWPGERDAYCDLAASVQQALEAAIFWLNDKLHALSPSRNLCFAGGVALNSVANQKLFRDGGWSGIHIIPAAEDSGPAIGAAYHALMTLRGQCPSVRARTDAFGRSYDASEIEDALAAVPATISARKVDAADACARALAAGKIVGFFSGPSEFGPRALGHRSILLDPRIADGKHVLNSRVKFREGFRPFAISILEDHVGEWFDLEGTTAYSPFMLRVLTWRAEKAIYDSVVHPDRSGRIQSVTARDEPALFALLSRFHALTGVPFVLNTSFNVMGEPIVETPDDALWALLYTDIDVLFLDGVEVRKGDDFRGILDLVPYWTNAAISLRCRAGEAVDLADIESLIFRVKGRWSTRDMEVPAEVYLALARLIDGRRSGHEIARLLPGDDRMPWIRKLGHLRRIGAVAFRAAPVPQREGTRADADATATA